MSVTDTSFTGGAPGIMAYGNSTADNWSGGDRLGGATYTVGGTVSGLSGTVVLQDNGGDNLQRDRERVVHVRDAAGLRGGLQRDGEDEPVRADLHGHQRVRDGGHGQRHQRRGVVRGNVRRTRLAGRFPGCPGRWCCRITAVTT